MLEASRQTRLAPRQTWLAQLADQLVPVASSYLRLQFELLVQQVLESQRLVLVLVLALAQELVPA